MREKNIIYLFIYLFCIFSYYKKKSVFKYYRWNYGQTLVRPLNPKSMSKAILYPVQFLLP